ncbi:TauD/TfdA family dioxygenase [Polyangium sp. 15x6]|nr:TauD/TfdA family dioxygenase [Polyangium sp. 15x6]MDI3290194.1 TauD/TfdA family dioxygenase [Polyangium sp. 15x6]
MANVRERAAQALLEVFHTPFLRAMTEPARIQIVRVLLVQGPLDVGAIAERVPQERSVVSRRKPGDVQWLKNSVVLHKRTEYEDWPEDERKRHLLRLWLAAPDFEDGDARLRRGVVKEDADKR